jgi:ABC-type transport system involved in multi-copper enzyme maturation permease subunit
MKYFAILRDSLRETIDAKVLYVMVALSILVMVVVASVSYRPLSMEEELRFGLGTINWLLRTQAQNQGGQKAIQFELKDLERTNEGTEPWTGDYRYQILMHYPSGKDATQQRNLIRMLRRMSGMMGTPASDPIQPLFKTQFPWLDELEVKETTSSDPAVEAYTVVSRGTKVADRAHWPHEPSLFFGRVPLSFMNSTVSQAVYGMENTLVNGLGAWVILLLGVVITAFFIPNMLRKGSIDLLLTKPLHRATLLLFKYIGGLLFVFLNLLIVVGGIWLVLGLRTGIWASGFLVSIPALTFYFAVLYAVSALIGVLTRSPIVCILVSVAFWLLLWAVGTGQSLVEGVRRAEKELAEMSQKMAEAGETDDTPPELPAWLRVPRWVDTVLSSVEYVLPRFRDLDRLMRQFLAQQLLTKEELRQRDLNRTESISWTESLTATGLFIAIVLGLACWRFSVADY